MIWLNATVSGALVLEIWSLLSSSQTYYLAVDLSLFLVVFLF